MNRWKNKLTNTLIHLPLDAQINPHVALIFMLLSLLQLTASITHPDSQIHLITKWFNPAFYSPLAAIILTALFTFAYLSLLILKITLTESDEIMVRPAMCMSYLGHVLAYLRAVCETIVPYPLLVGCLKAINQLQGPEILGISIVLLIIYTITVLPVGLYCKSDRSILTSNSDRKLRIINLQTILQIGKYLLVIVNQLSPEGVLGVMAIYIITHAIALIWKPFYCFHQQTLKRSLQSVVTFICIARICNSILKQNQGQALVQLIGSIGFVAFIEFLAMCRLKQQLYRETLSITQVKLLIFMVENMQEYSEHLQTYILKHKQKCSSIICKCRPLINEICDKNSNISAETAWWDFIASMIQRQFDLKYMITLPETQMKLKTIKYAELAYDLSQISLVKLSKINQSFIWLCEFETHAHQHQLQNLVSERKRKTFVYIMEEAMQLKLKQEEQTINQTAQKYIEYQIDYDNYFKLIIKTVNRVQNIWEQLCKRDPDAPTIEKDLALFKKWNSRIHKNYNRMVETYAQSNALLDSITSCYFEMVLNFTSDDPLHPVKQKEANKQATKVIDQSTRVFSYNSKTPMCFVSVESSTFGKIDFTNNFFDQVIKRPKGKELKVQDMLIPQMRSSHKQKMDAFVRGDQLSLSHDDMLIIDCTGKLIMSKMHVQLIFSLSKGLRYVVFLKTIHYSRKIFCFSNKSNLTHTSESFCEVFNKDFTEQTLKRRLSRQVLEDVKKNKLYELTMSEQSYKISYHREFQYEQQTIFMLELTDNESLEGFEQQIQRKTQPTCYRPFPDQGLMEGTSEQKKSRMSTTHHKNKKSMFATRRIQKKGQMVQDTNTFQRIAQKQKKIDERIKKSFGKLIQANSYPKIIKLIIIIMVIFSFISWFNFIFLAVYKHQNNNRYLNIAQSYTFLNELKMNLIDSTSNLQQLNIAPVVPSINTTEAFSNIKNIPNFFEALNQLVTSQQIGSIRKDWTSLKLHTNGTFQPIVQDYLMALSDFIRVPIATLSQDYNISDFAFPFTFDYLTPPLTLVEQHYHTFMINSLYFALPNLTLLMKQQIVPILNNALDNTPLIIISLMIVGLCTIGTIGMMVKSCIVVRVKHKIQRLFEEMKPDMIQKKLNKCQKLKSMFLVLEEDQINTFEPIIPVITRDKKSQFVRSSIMKSSSGILEENTERQLDINSMDTKTKQNLNEKKKSKKTFTFQAVQQKYYCFKVLLVMAPLIIVGIICAVMVSKELQQQEALIQFQRNIILMEQEIHLVRLYSIYHGTNPSLSAFPQYATTISSLLNTHIFTVLALVKLIMVGNQLSFAPKTSALFQIFGNSICQAEQQGIYVSIPYSFNGRGNYTYCSSLSNGILNQGFVASILHYAQNANRNFLANAYTSTYNQTQKQAYLNNFFLTNTSHLADYIGMTQRRLHEAINEDMKDSLDSYSMIITAIAIFGCVWVCFMLFCLRERFLHHYREHISDTKALLALISCRSVTQESQELKDSYLEKLDSLMIIK